MPRWMQRGDAPIGSPPDKGSFYVGLLAALLIFVASSPIENLPLRFGLLILASLVIGLMIRMYEKRR